MAKMIEGVEIFSVGKHRGSEVVEITENDLSEMVSSFTALGHEEGFRPVLKLGHSDAQAFFGNNKGAPNLGFVDKIWREGGKILANFSNVPDALVDLIRARRYNAVSIEMFPKTEVNGNTFTNVLTAVALLGAELPAVKGLKELAATLFTEVPDPKELSGDVLKLTEENEMTYSQEQLDQLVELSVSKATDAVRAEFAEKVTALEGAVTKAEEIAKNATDALRLYEVSNHEKLAIGMVDDAIKAGKILPKQKDTALAFAKSLTGQVKFGDGEKPAADVFKEFVDGLPSKVDFDEHGASDDDGENTDLDAGGEIHARTLKVQKGTAGMSYGDAYAEVLGDPKNADLKQRYFAQED